VRRAFLVVVGALGLALFVIAGVLLYTTRASLTVGTQIDPLRVLDIGVLLVIVIVLKEYFQGASARDKAERDILLREVSATRTSLATAYSSFSDLSATPGSHELFVKLNSSIMFLSQRLSALETLIVPKFAESTALFGLFCEFKSSCTSALPTQPTDLQQNLAESKRILLDLALVKLSVDIARHG
jgi:hypothetical protein